MKFGWETQEERLSRWIKIPAKKKLEWLRQMNELILKVSSKKQKKMRWKLRESR